MDEIKSKQRPKRRKLTFSQYYNASQLRADTWNRLKHDALQLAEAEARDRDLARLRDSVGEALELLEPIEGYWVFPGRDAITGLRRLLEAEDYRNLALLAGRIVRALSNDAYRRRRNFPAYNSRRCRGRERDRGGRAVRRGVGAWTAVFEVLVVDAMGPIQEAALKLGMRRPGDPTTRSSTSSWWCRAPRRR